MEDVSRIRTAACLALGLLAASAAAPRNALAQDDLVGPAQAIDGRTLNIGGTVVRLADVDAPDPAQTCTMAGRGYPCGEIARSALANLLAGARVQCRITARPPGSPPLADCLADGFDLSLNMVHAGWAVADPDQSPRYSRIETSAREARRGLWLGKFKRPAVWRRSISGE